MSKSVLTMMRCNKDVTLNGVDGLQYILNKGSVCYVDEASKETHDDGLEYILVFEEDNTRTLIGRLRFNRFCPI